MNIFLTGGAGYIGSATAEALIKAGHSVTCLLYTSPRWFAPFWSVAACGCGT